MGARGSTDACPRCGLERGGTADYCPACGHEYPAEDMPAGAKIVSPVRVDRTGELDLNKHRRHAARTVGATILPTNIESPSTFSMLLQRLLAPFRLVSIEGTVIHIDAPYQARVENGLFGTFMKILFGIIILPLTMIGYAAFTAMSWMIPGSDDKRESGFFNHLLSYSLIHRMHKPPETETVRDFRIRDDSGRERLVRIRGDFVAGNINPGDEVVVEGSDRAGTIVFRRGMNLRTQSHILVRRP